MLVRRVRQPGPRPVRSVLRRAHRSLPNPSVGRASCRQRSKARRRRPTAPNPTSTSSSTSATPRPVAMDPYYDLGEIAENAPLTDHLFTRVESTDSRVAHWTTAASVAQPCGRAPSAAPVSGFQYSAKPERRAPSTSAVGQRPGEIVERPSAGRDPEEIGQLRPRRSAPVGVGRERRLVTMYAGRPARPAVRERRRGSFAKHAARHAPARRVRAATRRAPGSIRTSRPPAQRRAT